MNTLKAITNVLLHKCIILLTVATIPNCDFSHAKSNEIFGPDTTVAQNLYSKAITLSNDKENSGEAITLLRQAKQLFANENQPNSKWIADCWTRIAELEIINKKYSIAVNYYDSALFVQKTNRSIISKENSQLHKEIAALHAKYLGDYTKAISHQSQFIQCLLIDVDSISLPLAAAYTDLATYHGANSDNTNEFDYYKLALDIRIKILGEAHPKVAVSYHNLSLSLYKLGETYTAVEICEKSISILLNDTNKIPNKTLGKMYNNAGVFCFTSGRLDQAAYNFEKALAIIQQSNNNAIEQASVLTNLSGVYAKLSKLEKAKLYQISAIEIFEDNLPENHPYLLKCQGNMGAILMNLGELETALNLVNSSIAAQEQLFGIKHQELFLPYQHAGQIHMELGDLNKARSKLLRSLEIAEHNAANREISSTFYLLGKLYFEFDSLLAADYYYRKSLDKSKFDEANPTYSSFEDIELIKVLIALQKLHATLYVRNYSTHNYNESIKWQELAIRVLSHYSNIAGEHTNYEIAKLKRSLYNTAILLQTQNNSKDSLLVSKCLDYSENTKSFLLYKGVSDANAIHFANLPPDILKREKKFKHRLVAMEIRRQNLINQKFTPSDSILVQLSSNISSLTNTYNNFKDSIQKINSTYYNLRHNLNVQSTFNIQKTILDTNSTIIEYHMADTSLYIIVINKYSEQIFRVDNVNILGEYVADIITDIRKSNATKYCIAAHELYKLLLKPFKNDLKQNIKIIPDDILAYIPFETLLIDSVVNPIKWNQHRYLLTQHQISYCYSSTLLYQMKNRQHQNNSTKKLLAFAPYFDGDTSTTTEVFRIVVNDEKKPLPSLNHTGEEVYGIQKMIGGDVFYNEDATKSNFISNASNYKVIHLATHAKANDKVGDYSYLAFTTRKDSVENELLFVRDLYNLELNADMVVLSACESGIGELKKGEGIISLARGMTYAGAKSIFNTLWAVNDRSTKNIMIDFYSNLKKGMTKDKALRLAKLKYIKEQKDDRTLAHPYYWSAMIGIGDMSPLDLK